jgi:hypothetical protein
LYKPTPPTIAQLKSKILRPATTSNFQCWFPPPTSVANWIKEKKSAGIDVSYNNEILELISLNCMEASLPGSTFATTEITDDYSGVTERHAYRRQYDDRSSFTFNVDNSTDNGKGSNYNVLLFFEAWMQYIVGEQYSEGLENPNYFYRVNFPADYQTPYIVVNKFEKDYKGNYLQYRFHQAYPLEVNSIQVSNESSQILQVTVSFTYTRYTIRTLPLSGLPTPNTPAATV